MQTKSQIMKQIAEAHNIPFIDVKLAEIEAEDVLFTHLNNVEEAHYGKSSTK